MTYIKPSELQECVNHIKERSLFPSLDVIPLLEKAISERVYGNVIVMLSDNHCLKFRVKNDDFDFAYEYKVNKDYLYGNVGAVVDDFLYNYQKEILKRYFKKGDSSYLEEEKDE